jgi:hypothetical protein
MKNLHLGLGNYLHAEEKGSKTCFLRSRAQAGSFQSEFQQQLPLQFFWPSLRQTGGKTFENFALSPKLSSLALATIKQAKSEICSAATAPFSTRGV